MFIDDTEQRAAHLARERRKARELRKQAWWLRRVADGICHYCGGCVDAATATMDHIVPLARGGRSTKGNIVLACKPCNSNKQAETPVEMILASISPL